MNDRELLELAAKAAGIVLSWPQDCGDNYLLPTNVASWKIWNPFGDRGDAMQLAVLLMIDVCHNHPADHHRWVLAERKGAEGYFPPACCVEDDFEEFDRGIAACRAIVRAASEIGKAMQ